LELSDHVLDLHADMFLVVELVPPALFVVPDQKPPGAAAGPLPLFVNFQSQLLRALGLGFCFVVVGVVLGHSTSGSMFFLFLLLLLFALELFYQDG